MGGRACQKENKHCLLLRVIFIFVLLITFTVETFAASFQEEETSQYKSIAGSAAPILMAFPPKLKSVFMCSISWRWMTSARPSPPIFLLLSWKDPRLALKSGQIQARPGSFRWTRSGTLLCLSNERSLKRSTMTS